MPEQEELDRERTEQTGLNTEQQETSRAAATSGTATQTAAPVQQTAAPVQQQQSAPPATQPPVPQPVQPIMGGQTANPMGASTTGATMSAGQGQGEAQLPPQRQTANPVSAGATGATPNEDSAGGAASAGSGEGFNINGIQMNRESWSGTMNFMGNSIALAQTAMSALNGEDVSFNNIAIPSVATGLFSLTGAKIESVVFNRTEGFKSATITAGAISVGAGMKLFFGEKLKATINRGDGEYKVELEKAVLNALGTAQPIGLAGTYLKIGAEGTFIEGGAGQIESQKFKIQELKIGQDGLHLKEAQVVLPPLGGNPLDLKFVDIKGGLDGKWQAQGSVEPNTADKKLSFLSDKLKVSEIQANVNISPTKFLGDLKGKASYDDGLTKVNGQIAITLGDKPNLQLVGGTAETNMGGMKFVGEGISMSLAPAAVIKIDKGSLDAPQLGSKFAVTLKGGLINAEQGFSFTEMKLATGGAVEIFPNFKVGGTVQVRKDATTQAYSLAVTNGKVDSKDGIAGMGIKATTSFTYNETEGLKGSVSQAKFTSNFFDISSTGAILFDSNGFTVPTTTATLKGLGGKTPLTATATGVAYNKEKGLTITSLKGQLPKIGTAQPTAEINNIEIGSGFKADEAKLDFGSGLQLAGEYIKVNNIQGGAQIKQDGSWNFNTQGDLAVTNIPNFTGSGTVKVGYDSTNGVDLKIQNGSIQTTIQGAEIKATDLGYDSKAAKVTVKKAEAKLPEFQGVQTTATVKNATLGAAGIEGSIEIAANGAVELMPGVQLTALKGSYSNVGGKTKIGLKTSATIQSSSFNGTITNVGLDMDGTTKKFSAQGLTINSKYFDVTVKDSVYDSATGAFTMANATVKGKGLEKFGNPKINATGVKYDKNGFEIASFDTKLGWEGKADIIQVKGTAIKLPATGAPSGTIDAQLLKELSLAGGALKVDNPQFVGRLDANGWGISATAKIGVNVSGATASGDLNIAYDSATGVTANVSNGQFEANYANLGLNIKADQINYDSAKSELKIATGTVTVSKDKLRSETDLTGAVTNLTVKGKDINFDSLKVAAGGLKMKVMEGVEVGLQSATLTKNGTAFKAKIEGGLTVNRTAPVMVKGNATAALEYDLAKKAVSGTVSTLNLETSIFKTKVKDAKFDSTGFNIAEARLSLGSGLDPATMKKYIPGFQPWMLDFVQGVEFVAQNIHYDATKGLTVGNFYPDIPPIEFEMMGFKGILDLRNQKGSISGQKEIKAPDVKTPQFKIPIIPGLSAEVGASATAGVKLGANISMAKKGDYWDLSGGVTVGAYGEVSVTGMAIADGGIISAGAGIKATGRISATGSANIGGGVRYNPNAKGLDKIEQATPLKFSYKLNAALQAKLDLLLKVDVLFGLFNVYERAINIGQWDIATLDIWGESEAQKPGDILANLKNHVRVNAFGQKVYEKI